MCFGFNYVAACAFVGTCVCVQVYVGRTVLVLRRLPQPDRYEIVIALSCHHFTATQLSLAKHDIWWCW